MPRLSHEKSLDSLIWPIIFEPLQRAVFDSVSGMQVSGAVGAVGVGLGWALDPPIVVVDELEVTAPATDIPRREQALSSQAPERISIVDCAIACWLKAAIERRVAFSLMVDRLNFARKLLLKCFIEDAHAMSHQFG